MNDVLVDSNILIDVAWQDSAWREWSSKVLALAADSATLVINPLIYAEVSVGFDSAEDLDHHLPGDLYRREALPWEAAFLAGQCFAKYRQRGGVRSSPLPDFYIGAHAAVLGYHLLTRDPRRYRNYFPTLELIAPNEA